MKFLADLHIHSHLSRATSKDLTLEHLHAWAQRKGIGVVGTGDFTHPAWFAELREKLVPAEPGLFALREDLARAADERVPAACRAPVRFMLSVEVSSIYKRDGKVRKVHNLAYAPDLESAARISARLARIGNIASDGRPILGLDSRDFLEIVLESSRDTFVVPAHIWTPWFSALGAQSGFDAIEACFADLAPEIFAVETGLSSDPAMNWRLSALDRYALVSNSDAHSPEKLGREASLFDCELSYFGLRDALRDRRQNFLGTLEFFPEEGKYHFDGHRRCGISFRPEDARSVEGVCPKCNQRLTAGVAGRVAALADRPEGVRPDVAKPYESLIPLAELIGEVVGTGATSARVKREYEQLLRRVGPELGVLRELPVEDVGRVGPPLFAEAIQRMRNGQVHLEPGYDGEYGVVRVFGAEERRRLLAQRSFAFPGFAEQEAPMPAAVERGSGSAPSPDRQRMVQVELLPQPELNAEQARVVHHPPGPLLVLAGPGTGKTRVIAQRIARWVRSGVSPRTITAITFTRRAARELRERLDGMLGARSRAIGALTFHALGLELLRSFAVEAGLRPEFLVLDEAERAAALAAALAVLGCPPSVRWAAAIAGAKARLIEPECAGPELAPVYAAYERELAARGALDFDDLIRRAIQLLESHPAARAAAEERCRHLCIDEWQDVSPAQERFVQLLAPAAPEAEVCAVGDPDQSIYGFRGSDPACVERFVNHYAAAVLPLSANYRCPVAVVRAATQLIESAPGRPKRELRPERRESGPIERVDLGSEREEAEFIAAEIERALGGTSLESLHMGRAEGHVDQPFAFHEIAVLFRISAQAEAIEQALDRAGIPHQRAGDALTERPEVVALLERLRTRASSRAAVEHRTQAVADQIRALAREGTAELAAPAARRLLEAADLLATLALPFGGDAGAFLADLPLWQAGELDLSPERVALLTLHAAKGLEFKLVFIAGCEAGLLPLALPGRAADAEEERRLLYVGMTRAEQRLVLTRAERRALRGDWIAPAPSPFLDGLAAEWFSTSTPPGRRRRAVQLALL